MKKIWIPALIFIIFEATAISLWLIKGTLFYLFNFSYIGIALSIGIFLFVCKA